MYGCSYQNAAHDEKSPNLRKHHLVPRREMRLEEPALKVDEIRRDVDECADCREVDARHDALKQRSENAIAVLRNEIQRQSRR